MRRYVTTAARWTVTAAFAGPLSTLGSRFCGSGVGVPSSRFVSCSAIQRTSNTSASTPSVVTAAAAAVAPEPRPEYVNWSPRIVALKALQQDQPACVRQAAIIVEDAITEIDKSLLKLSTVPKVALNEALDAFTVFSSVDRFIHQTDHTLRPGMAGVKRVGRRLLDALMSATVDVDVPEPLVPVLGQTARTLPFVVSMSSNRMGPMLSEARAVKDDEAVHVIVSIATVLALRHVLCSDSIPYRFSSVQKTSRYLTRHVFHRYLLDAVGLAKQHARDEDAALYACFSNVLELLAIQDAAVFAFATSQGRHATAAGMLRSAFPHAVRDVQNVLVKLDRLPMIDPDEPLRLTLALIAAETASSKAAAMNLASVLSTDKGFLRVLELPKHGSRVADLLIASVEASVYGPAFSAAWATLEALMQPMRNIRGAGHMLPPRVAATLAAACACTASIQAVGAPRSLIDKLQLVTKALSANPVPTWCAAPPNNSTVKVLRHMLRIAKITEKMKVKESTPGTVLLRSVAHWLSSQLKPQGSLETVATISTLLYRIGFGDLPVRNDWAEDRWHLVDQLVCRPLLSRSAEALPTTLREAEVTVEDFLALLLSGPADAALVAAVEKLIKDKVAAVEAWPALVEEVRALATQAAADETLSKTRVVELIQSLFNAPSELVTRLRGEDVRAICQLLLRIDVEPKSTLSLLVKDTLPRLPPAAWLDLATMSSLFDEALESRDSRGCVLHSSTISWLLHHVAPLADASPCRKWRGNFTHQ